MRAKGEIYGPRVIHAPSASLRPSKKCMTTECECVWACCYCSCLALFKKIFMVHLSVKVIFTLNSKASDAYIDEKRQQKGNFKTKKSFSMCTAPEMAKTALISGLFARKSAKGEIAFPSSHCLT